MTEPAQCNNVVSILLAITVPFDGVFQKNEVQKKLVPKPSIIARSDMLIVDVEGKDAENIKLGSAFSNDQLANKRFDFQFVNQPYGYEWSKDFDGITMADLVLANGNMSSNQSCERDFTGCSLN